MDRVRGSSARARVALAAAVGLASIALGWVALRVFQIGVIHGFRFQWWWWGIGVAVAALGGVGAVTILGVSRRPSPLVKVLLFVGAGIGGLFLLHLPVLWTARLRGVYLAGSLGDDLATDVPLWQVGAAFATGLLLALAMTEGPVPVASGDPP